VSIFLGDQLTDIFEQLAAEGAKTSKQGGQLKLGISSLPPLPKDCTDRNRTSPFAFTGNKFEFRMVGSTQSTAGPTFVLNTIVADVLAEIADELEKAGDVTTCVQGILKRIATEHSHVIYNGDNYTDEWVEEAKKRKLPNICSTVESLNTIMDEENVNVFERQNVLTKAELQARTEILLEAYSMQINIEALTMLNMVKRQILPACVEYSSRLAGAVESIKSAGVSADTQKAMLEKLCGLISSLDEGVKKLEKDTGKAGEIAGVSKQAEYYREVVIEAMSKVRQAADQLEAIVDAELWPLPTYAEMLFLK